MPEMEMYRKGRPKPILSKAPLGAEVSENFAEKVQVTSCAGVDPSPVIPIAQVAGVPRGEGKVAATMERPTPTPVLPEPQLINLQAEQHMPPMHVPNVPPVQGGQSVVFLPLMEDHLEELNRHQQVVEDPAGSKSINNAPPSMAAKSLSALKSRKEEIKDTLEDMVGRDETERLAHLYQERAKGGKSAGALNVAIGISSPPGTEPLTSCYSIWTSKSVATLPTITSTVDFGSTPGLSAYRTRDATVADEDVEIPWSETPMVSRFGPISRRGVSIMRPSKAKQSLAPMGDEPMPTAVVRHSKQAAKPAPSQAAILLQNGGRTTLQPVAVGANGEIGYIAVPEPTQVIHEQMPAVIPAHQNPMAVPQHQNHTAILQAHQMNMQATALPMMPAQPVLNQRRPPEVLDTASVAVEYERMKHELGILQQKVSDLNLAQQQMWQNRDLYLASSQPDTRRTPEAQLQRDLTSELQLIEKTIRDREMELQINQCMIKDHPRGLDYGSYVDHGLVEQSRRADDSRGHSTGFYQQFH